MSELTGLPRCRTCRYWDGDHDGDPEESGDCRRFPPAMPNSAYVLGMTTLAGGEVNPPWYGVWPTTEGTDWCGEHRPVEIGGDGGTEG